MTIMFMVPQSCLAADSFPTRSNMQVGTHRAWAAPCPSPAAMNPGSTSCKTKAAAASAKAGPDPTEGDTSGSGTAERPGWVSVAGLWAELGMALSTAKEGSWEVSEMEACEGPPVNGGL